MQSTPGVASVVAIDARLPLLSGMAHLLASGRGFMSLQDALPHVDAVVIATPPATHVPLGLEAIRAGKHVLIEKPLATTAAGALALMEAAKDAGVTLMVGHTFEYNGAVWMLRELVQTQELGELYYLDSARLNLGLVPDRRQRHRRSGTARHLDRQLCARLHADLGARLGRPARRPQIRGCRVL